jgi:hypothetical protein
VARSRRLRRSLQSSAPWNADNWVGRREYNARTFQLEARYAEQRENQPQDRREHRDTAFQLGDVGVDASAQPWGCGAQRPICCDALLSTR